MRRSFRGTVKKQMKEDILSYLAKHEDDWVLIGELHRAMTERGYRNKAIAEVFLRLRLNLFIVYADIDNKLYIAKVPDDIKEKLLEIEVVMLHRAKTEFRAIVMSELRKLYQDSYVEHITI